MKKLLATILFLPLIASAQEEANSLIRIGITGGYVNHANSTGTFYLNSSATNASDWNVGLSAGVAFNGKWEVGLGVEYQHQEAIGQAKLGMLIESYTGNSINYFKFSAIEVTTTTSSLWIGHVYSSCYWQLFNRLYLTPTATLGFGKTKIKTEAVSVAKLIEDNEGGFYSGSGEPRNSILFMEQSLSSDVFAIYLSPRLTYFFNKHIAVTLNLGGVQCSLVDWEWSSKQWVASLSPIYWQYGMIIAF